MTEDFLIQCQNCGTLYNDLQDVCPYCGEPQPDITEDAAPAPEEYPLEPPLEEEPVAHQEHILSDDDPNLLLQGPFPTDQHPEAEYLPEDEHLLPEDPFVDDDIFAVAGETDEIDEHETAYLDDYDDYEDGYDLYPAQVEQEQYDEFDEFGEVDDDPTPSHFTWRRILSGCLGLLLCLGLLFGGLGLLAVREGLEERALIAQTESQGHYQKGQEHLANDSIELAIAEFEQALSLNPNFPAARLALRQAQKIAQAQPTPTSETRSAAASDFLAKAEAQMRTQNWVEAIQTLSQVRDLDPDYQAEHVSALLYEANYQLGLQLITPDQLEEALTAFEQALAERPGDSQALAEQAKASLYLAGIAVEGDNKQQAVKIFGQLYQQEENYLDVKQRLWHAYELFGDELAKVGEWCQAEVQYNQANTLQTSSALEIKTQNSNIRCQETQTDRPTPRATSTPPVAAAINTNVPQPTPVITPTNLTTPVTYNDGSIIFSAFNPFEARWEIVSVPASGGSSKVLVTNATMPAISPNGQLLLYHSELVDAEGLHVLDLVTGEDRRATSIKTHILPRWGSDNNQFLFTAQEAGTGRWQVHRGFADAKSGPLIIRDGRTPDWSPNGSTIAYQGSDAKGNNPGIYLVPFAGDEPTRLTNHESDRSPAFSPDGSQLAYMSTRNGNWDIYTISVAGSTSRQITTASGNDGLPVWSPDGSQIAYVSDSDGSWAIYVIDAGGGTPTKVIEWDGSNRPDWLLAQIWWAKEIGRR